jgi:hypothetical protein
MMQTNWATQKEKYWSQNRTITVTIVYFIILSFLLFGCQYFIQTIICML